MFCYRRDLITRQLSLPKRKKGSTKVRAAVTILPDTLRATAEEEIIIVRTDPCSARGLEEALRDAGYRVGMTFECVNELVSPLAEVRLAIMVISNPPLHTRNTCSAIQWMSPTLPVIVIGPDCLSTKLNCFEQGADDYINEVFDRHELLARIKSAIRRHTR